jgi:carbonic anhydrase/acetyltransferase-like protein (isoleucine patch superfamily)
MQKSCVRPFYHKVPVVPATAYVDPAATVIGDVTLGEHASVWPNAVLRGDINAIRLGDYSNIQDNSVLHVGDDEPCLIGNFVVAGHAVRLHGCTIEDRCLIGIGAIVLNRARVGEGCIIAAGTLVPEGMQLEPGSLYMGAPAKLRRKLEPHEIDKIAYMARKYAFIAQAYKKTAVAEAAGQTLTEADWEAARAAFQAE